MQLSALSVGLLLAMSVLAVAGDVDHPWWKGRGAKLPENCQAAKDRINSAYQSIHAKYGGYELEVRSRLLSLLELKLSHNRGRDCDLIASVIIEKHGKN